MKKIKSIEVRNSPFYEDIKIDFSDKLNCIMGGRGTGKSTLLYFLKSSIFKSSERERKTYDILKANLGNGEIIVEMETNDGALYRIIKTLNDDPQPYKAPNSEYISIDKLFEDIECDFYETGKIEEIGRSEKDRLMLLDKKIKNQILPYEESINQIQIDLDANAQDIKSLNQRLIRITEALTQFEGIEIDFELHKSTQPLGLKEEEKKEFEEADLKEKTRKSEKRFFEKLFELLNTLNFNFMQHDSELRELQENLKGGDNISFINREIMNHAVAISSEALVGMTQNVKSILNGISQLQEKLETSNSQVNEQHDLQQAEFIKVKQKFEEHREYINKYHLLSKRLNDKQTLRLDEKELVDKRGKLKTHRGQLVNRLNQLKQTIFKIRLQSINELNANFDGAIVINLIYAGITTKFEDKLKEALKGSGMRYNELVPRIIEKFSTDEFAKIVHSKDVNSLKTITGIDEARSINLINSLYETEAIYELEALYCDDLPVFKLRLNEEGTLEENYRNSDELSMGQRCTTVLPIIFAVSKNPLVIDQPEDNLDNKFISDRIHEIIRLQKEERQLIFITHNPNIPVLSECEQNIFLKYDRKSSLDIKGNIDEVKDEIVSLLEGGEKAFEKRRVTYKLN